MADTRRTRTALLALLLAAPAARAEAPPRSFAAYALVVGSQRPGAGQEALRFAADDARRVRNVLVELGGVEPERARLLLNPGAAELRGALDAMDAELAARAARDERTAFLFYYSGHARAAGLSLGGDELPLAELRERLEALPATLRVVVLDACQSGAISSIKGAEAARAFSFNSVNDLNTSGMAVLASSSGDELSQESEAIGGSFFTHHLVSGLRGAADGDDDGRVTLSEAYRYAHDRTLLSTAETAVGKQHVTLETALRGKGEMVLTYPAAASARLELPAALAGEILVHREPTGSIVAEVFKAGGDRVRLALPPGAYGAVLRRDSVVERCPLTLVAEAITALDPGACERVPVAETTAKGAPPSWAPTVSLELGFGLLWDRHDAYSDRLEDFGYQAGELDFPVGHLAAAALYHLDPNLAVGLFYSTLDMGDYSRDAYQAGEASRDTRFEWLAQRLGVQLRAGLPIWGGVLTPYAQAGGGLTLARTTLRGDEVGATTETYWGYHLALGAGLQVMPWDGFGFYGQAEYVYAPTIDNLLGDTHDSGGFTPTLGLRFAL